MRSKLRTPVPKLHLLTEYVRKVHVAVDGQFSTSKLALLCRDERTTQYVNCSVLMEVCEIWNTPRERQRESRVVRKWKTVRIKQELKIARISQRSHNGVR